MDCECFLVKAAGYYGAILSACPFRFFLGTVIFYGVPVRCFPLGDSSALKLFYDFALFQ